MVLVEQKTDRIDHLVYGWPILTPIEYKESLDEIGHCILWKVCKYSGTLDCGKCYKHQPEDKGATLLWKFAIQTDRKIKNNRPDIKVKDYKRKYAF